MMATAVPPRSCEKSGAVCLDGNVGDHRRTSRRKVHDMARKSDQTTQRILQCIGKRVTFKYPGTEGHKHGVLTDRTVCVAGSNDAGVPYWNVIDLINFQDDPRNPWMRLGYYRRKDGRLIWGSQTTATFTRDEWKELFTQSAKEKPWFQRFLREVLAEVERRQRKTKIRKED
jgi:hypothetical protein